MKMIRKPFVWVAGLVVLGVLIQFVPYGYDHTNPPVMQEPQWDSLQTRTCQTRLL